eukprot:Gb_20744 [translate_table: standard]
MATRKQLENVPQPYLILVRSDTEGKCFPAVPEPHPLRDIPGMESEPSEADPGIQFENCSEVGVFSKLTNAYCLVPIAGSENFHSIFESELADVIPVVKTSIAGSRVIGRVCVGNKNGLLLPNTTTDQGKPSWLEFLAELQHLRNSLPDQVVVQRVEERLSALGNCVVCNDHVALIHTDLDKVPLYFHVMLQCVWLSCQSMIFLHKMAISYIPNPSVHAITVPLVICWENLTCFVRM